jgi:DnaA-homolog protein
MRQLPLAIGPAPLPTFDSFIAGSHAANAAALAHLRSLPQPGAAPLYLWGPSGSGKTHLLQALAGAAQARGARLGWFDAASPLPWPYDAAWSLVVLDAVEGFDEARQRAAFALFIEATAQGAQLAAAGSLPPVDLPLREDLRSRLGWGHVFALQPLAEADARAALRREADRRGIFLSDEVMAFLLTRFARDLKHLMALLDRLDEYALAEHRAVTVPLLRKMFEQEGSRL